MKKSTAAPAKSKQSGPAPLLVGEVNLRSNDASLDLSYLPLGGSGSRLAEILNMDAGQYYTSFLRINLCRGEWNIDRASEVAYGIHLASTDTNRVVVLLGAKVCQAFSLIKFTPFSLYRMSGYTIIQLPHPSGRCRIWNDLKNCNKARLAFFEAGINLPRRVTP